MFGFSFGELVVLVIVGLIVVGPKELPKILKKLGYWSGKIRRFALDMRVQSGIDDALRTEGLADDINEIRKLARGELDGVVAATRNATRLDELPELKSASATAASPYGTSSAPVYGSSAPYDASPTPLDDPNAIIVDRDREYPVHGADSYGALPDTAIVYAEGLPRSPLADDPLYTLGELREAGPGKSIGDTASEARS